MMTILWIFPLLVIGQFRPADRSSIIDNDGTEIPQEPESKVIPRVVSWRLKHNGAYIDSIRLDTVYNFFHNYHPAYKHQITNTYTGNYGGAYLGNNFFNRNYSQPFYFARNHSAYMLTPGELLYFNTTTPYTMLDYSQSENKNRRNETRFNVLHSQNVNRDLNFTFRYDQAKSDGQYNFQQNRNNAIAIYGSYNTNKLQLYAGFISNRIRNSENGGMVDDNNLLDIPTQENISVRLTDARSEIRSSWLFSNAEYIIGISEVVDENPVFRPILSFILESGLTANSRIFKEGEGFDNSEFFPDYYLQPDFSHDSVRFTSIYHVLQLKSHERAQKRFSFGQRAYLGVDIDRRIYAAPGYASPVYPFHPGIFDETTYIGPEPRWNVRNYTNAYIGVGLFRHLGEFWKWEVEGRQYFSGYKAGQTNISGNIVKNFQFAGDSLSFFRISGDLINRVPDYFQQQYFSNRVKWNNNLVNEQTMNARILLVSPLYNFEAGAGYSLINNFIYHNYNGIPDQLLSEQLVLGAHIKKEFTLGNASLLTHGLWQKASAEQYLHLPQFSLRIVPSYYLVISKVLYTQFGVDIRANTKYFADAFQPATGFFYLQNEKRLGEFPYMDAFANLRLKRTRVFFQMLNFGTAFIRQPYFTSLNYPMNRMTFRLGVAWSFYD